MLGWLGARDFLTSTRGLHAKRTHVIYIYFPTTKKNSINTINCKLVAQSCGEGRSDLLVPEVDCGNVAWSSCQFGPLIWRRLSSDWLANDPRRILDGVRQLVQVHCTGPECHGCYTWYSEEGIVTVYKMNLAITGWCTGRYLTERRIASSAVCCDHSDCVPLFYRLWHSCTLSKHQQTLYCLV